MPHTRSGKTPEAKAAMAAAAKAHSAAVAAHAAAYKAKKAAEKLPAGGRMTRRGRKRGTRRR